MCTIPLDLERRFEQRWAARFFRPKPQASPQKHGLEKRVSSPHPAKVKATHGVLAVNVATKPNGPGTAICRGRQPWGGFLPAGVWGALAGSVESTRQNHAGSVRLWHVLCRRTAGPSQRSPRRWTPRGSPARLGRRLLGAMGSRLAIAQRCWLSLTSPGQDRGRALRSGSGPPPLAQTKFLFCCVGI